MTSSHDFPDRETGTAIPYGIYDLAGNAGFVNVGTDHDTPAFAVESVRQWWQVAGRGRYPGARRLLITADAGGSSDHRKRAWKAGLAELAAQTGLEITVCHFPPGTSKWNKIEHRLFCHISRTWRARPLASHQVIIDTIAATSTAAGLVVTARLDLGRYPAGAEVSDERMRELEDTVLTRHDFHGDWNYTLQPVPRAAPAPAAGPEPAAPQLEALASPALTGMTRQAFDALAAALQIPCAAAREQRLHLHRGGPRRATAGPKGPIRHSQAAYLLAAIYRYRLGMPGTHIASLPGADQSTISVATRRIQDALTSNGTPLTPGPHQLRTLGELRQQAAANGITIPGPGTTAPVRHTTEPRHTANSP